MDSYWLLFTPAPCTCCMCQSQHQNVCFVAFCVHQLLQFTSNHHKWIRNLAWVWII